MIQSIHILYTAPYACTYVYAGQLYISTHACMYTLYCIRVHTVMLRLAPQCPAILPSSCQV